MATTKDTISSSAWKGYEKILFRLFFIYFFLLAVPLDWKFYNQLFSVDWSSLHYGDIFNLSHYTPRFFAGADTFANWVAIFALSLIGAAIWTGIEPQRTEYRSLYYWIRVIVRYRLAIALFAYGFIKLFPLQSPLPSISNLNTPYGDYNRWKLFSLSLGIVPSYQFFLGLVEVLIGVLLLYRKTASIAAFFVLIFTGNVFASNIAYDGGEYIYSLYLISLAIFILIYDLKRIVNLLILQRPTRPNRFKPIFPKGWQHYGRIALKTGVVLFFIVLYGFKTRSGYKNDSFQYPRTPGLRGYTGIYNVSEFQINNQSIPYSLTDENRWQDIVFEKWNTISIRSNRPVIYDSTNVDYISKNEKDRIYELEGTTGRHYYSYEADTINHVLLLNNRNKNYAGETLKLSYHQNENGKLTLSGIDQNKDSVYVVLDKLNKKYLLEEVSKQGRRRGLKL